MQVNKIRAYPERLDDPSMLMRDTTVLHNFLQSCSRQISSCYRNTGIPGTSITGVDVFINSTPNMYRGDSDRRINVELSVVESEMEWVSRNHYLLHPTIQARITESMPAYGADDASILNSEEQFRDSAVRLAVIEALYLAMLVVPYFKGDEDMDSPIPVIQESHVDSMTPVLTLVYSIPVGVEFHTGKPAELILGINIGGEEAVLKPIHKSQCIPDVPDDKKIKRRPVIVEPIN